MSENRPFSGVRVLDLTTVVVGPTATLRLADFGAEVIKVEAPTGDVLRRLGGPSPSGMASGKYLHFNRGKRSVCLDLKKETARDVLQEIMGQCDVFVSNMRPAALKRLGLDPASCHARNPALVHCTITGFGPDGPYTGQPAYDTVVQGVAGVAGLMLRRDGAPRYVPLLICDHTVGEIAASAISAALFKRARDGEGATIEVPMFETMAAYVLQEHLGSSTFQPPIGRAGDGRVLDPNNTPARTSDGWISLSANTDPQASGFLRAIGRPELIEDPRFCSVAARFKNAGAWFDLRSNALLEKPTAHWLAVFAEFDVPAMTCHTLETLPDDAHLTEVGLTSVVEHPTEGEVVNIRSTILSEGRPAPAGHVAQPLGWDTLSVLDELGIGGSRVEALLAEGAAMDGRASARLAEAGL